MESFLKATVPTGESQGDAYEWMCGLIQCGASLTTRRKYASVMKGVFNRFAGTEDAGDNPFDKIKELSAYRVTKEDYSAGNIEILDRNINSWYGISAANPSVGVFIYMLLAATFSFEEALSLTFDNAVEGVSQIDELVNGNRTHHRQTYVFRFDRNRIRLPRLCSGVAEELSGIFKGTGMKFLGDRFSEDDAAALWIRKANEKKIPFWTIRSVISRIPPQFSYLSLIPSVEVSPENRLLVLQSVADAFISIQPQWHVMKLRRNVSREQVEEILSDKFPRMSQEITFFYPTKNVVSKVGKKTVKEEVPYIPGILFFNVRTDKVTAIFREIGELAWCYRRTDSQDSPYTVIPRREMELFQLATGQFSGDMDMEMTSGEPIGIGRKVRILTGPMAGKETTVYDVKVSGDQNSQRRVCYLRLSSLSNIRWTLALPETSLQPIE